MSIQENSRPPRLPIAGLLLLIIGTLIGGVGVGLLLFLTSKFVYLIFASIILTGALAGAVLIAAVQVGKVRSGAAAIFFGIITGALLYGTYRYVEYLDVRQLFRDEIYAEDPKAASEDVEALIDEFLESETGSSGFVGLVRLDAKEGMTISRVSSSSDMGTPLSTELTVGYWVLEILIALGIPAGMALGATNRQFCEDTNRWFIYRRLGQVKQESMDAFMSAIQQGDFRLAGSLLVEKGRTPMPYLMVEAGRCSDQAREGRLRVTVYRPGRNNTQQIVNTTIPAADYTALTQR
ncbi:MAG: hypothetical protein K8I30_11195 [Anaerolineae bacterium]|nr:hypothetical protein [Anaerolineae bacterium]